VLGWWVGLQDGGNISQQVSGAIVGSELVKKEEGAPGPGQPPSHSQEGNGGPGAEQLHTDLKDETISSAQGGAGETRLLKSGRRPRQVQRHRTQDWMPKQKAWAENSDKD
jgi:hypothetical protein